MMMNRRMNAPCIAVSLSTFIVLAACGSGSGDRDGPSVGGNNGCEVSPPTLTDASGQACTTVAILGNVDSCMRDYYLFRDQVPTVQLTDYDSPEALVRDLRFAERDPFSRVSDTATSAAFLEEGLFYGFGFAFKRDENGVWRLLSVSAESPAAEAGLERGDTIVSVDGIDFATLIQGAGLGSIGGTREEPVSSRWQLRRRDDGSLYEVDLTRVEFRHVTVDDEALVQLEAGDLVGYFSLDSFLRVSEAEIDTVFADYVPSGVSDMVIDLRYNGGGFVNVAVQLASLLGGADVVGQLLMAYRYNEAYSSRNFDYRFTRETNARELQNVVFLVDGGTASASEIVINGLKPYVRVTVIGEVATSGKPFISRGNDFCGKRLDAMEAEGFNASNVSVGEGIVPDCHAVDDLSRQRGRDADGNTEGMLQAAIDFLERGRCDSAPAATPPSKRQVVDESTMQEFEPLGAIR